MNLEEKIDNDIKSNLKEGKSEELSVLRLLKSAIKNAAISKNDVLTEQETVSVLEKQAKQRRDSIDQYVKGGRPELADKERFELELIETYLPQKMDEESLAKLVESSISELGATSMVDMGRVIKDVMTKAAGSADGGTVSKIVKEKLG